MNRLLIVVLFSLTLLGCGDDQGKKAAESYTLEQQIVIIETKTVPDSNDPLVIKTEAQLKQVSLLTGLKKREVGDQVMFVKNMINEQTDYSVTFFDIMDWLTSSNEVGIMLNSKSMKLEEVLAIYATGAGA